MTLSEKVSNYIKFSYIKEFIDDLCNVYDYNGLISYQHFLKAANILEDCEDFVDSFRNGLDGKSKIVYCEGVFIDIPKLLSKKDENFEIIIAHLTQIKEIFNNPESCPEYVFFNKYCRKMNENRENIGSFVQQIGESKPSSETTNLLNVMLKPTLNKITADYHKDEIKLEKLLKIIVLILYEQLTDKTEDCEVIKSMIKFVANNSIKDILEKKMEFLVKLMSLKSISPVKSLILQNIPLA